MATAHPATSSANIDVTAALAEAVESYRARNPESLAQYRQACAALPGGNTRSAIYVDPFPLTIARGEGAHLWDLDGHEYADFLSEFTAGIFGHSHPAIRKAIEAALDDGINLGAQNTAEARFAAAICARIPSIELVRFTNSGTEANLMAVSAACAITGRKKILVFNGGYHGGVFYFRGHGSVINAPFDFVIADYNDTAGTRALVEANRGDLAAILIEPMLGGGGCIPAERDFLAELRRLASETGAILIFDEVMTSRLAPGGLQEVHGIAPDLTTLGKYVGGGMSFGAFGGKAALMEWFDPRRQGGFQHAGTFNNNMLTMRAGLAGLTEVYTPERAAALNAFGDRLRARLNAIAVQHGLAMQFTGIGSMIGVHMTARPIRSAADAAAGDADLLALFYYDATARGVWLAKRGMMALSVALDDADADRLAAAVEEFAASRAPLFAGGGAGMSEARANHRIAYFNGRLVPEREVLVPFRDRSFKYGDAAFDMTRTFAGRPFKLKEHVERLYRSLRYLRIDPGLTSERMVAISEEVLDRNRHFLTGDTDYWIGQRVSRGVDAVGDEGWDDTGPTVIVECIPLPLQKRARLFRDGIDIVVPPTRRAAPDVLSPRAKTHNYLNLITADFEAKAQDPEAWSVLLDANGHLAEGIGSNVFLVQGGEVLTPLARWVLPGVSRQTVIDLCNDAGIPCREADLDLYDAANADEMFMTSTSLCLCPVRSIGGRRLPAPIPGPVTRRLTDAYARFVDCDFVAQYLRHLSG